MHWIALIFLIPYVFILTVIWRNLKRIKPAAGNRSGVSIFVTVVIPFRNEEVSLPLLLDDLAAQDYPSSLFEVIVVDDNSDDSSFRIASEFKKIKNLSVLKNLGTGKKQAIRTGVKNSSGRLIVTTDADCRTGAKWLETICSCFSEHVPGMLICPVQLESGKGLFGRFQELEFLSLQGVTAGSTASGNPVMCNGANLAFKKELYLRHSRNLHDEIQSGDDIFLLHSIKKEPGVKIMWLGSPDATVTTSSAKDLKEFIQQRKRWLSKGKVYDDAGTIILAIVTFVTNFTMMLLIIATFLKPEFFALMFAAAVLKAAPDYLILSETTRRYGKKQLMKWFLPSEIIYPFYVTGISIISILTSGKRKVNYPSPKGT